MRSFSCLLIVSFLLLGASTAVAERRADRAAQDKIREATALLSRIARPAEGKRPIVMTFGTTQVASRSDGRVAALFEDGSWLIHKGYEVKVFTPARGVAGPASAAAAFTHGSTPEMREGRPENYPPRGVTARTF